MSRDAETSHLTPAEGTEPDDAMLMAFADDALPAETAAALARRIAADPRLAARVGRYKADRALLRAAFDPVLEEPVPERLIAAIGGGAATSGGGRPELRVVAGGAAPTGMGAAGRTGAARGAGPRRWWPLALAASLALLLGYGAGRLGGPAGPASASLAGLAEAPALTRLAEAELTGGAAELPGGARAVLLGTVRLPDGGLCREVEIAGPGAAGTALLCRETVGGWAVAALLAERPPAAATGFVPAAGEAAASRPLWTALGAVRLDAEAEQAAREAGWR